MLTHDKIKTYKKYDGNVDSWVRSGSKKEKLVMNDSDSYIIDGLIQYVYLVKKGLASSSFSNGLNCNLTENCDSEETTQALKTIIGL